MRINIRVIFTAIAIGFGLVVLLGYFVDAGPLGVLRRVFLQWAVILAAVALIVGGANLASVHLRKISTRQPGSLYSLVLLLFLAITVLVAGFFGPNSTYGLWLFNYIEVPVESSLLAVLAVILAYASARVLRRRLNTFSLIFLGTVLLFLVGTVSIPMFPVPALAALRDWFAEVLVVGGARGILLGVALGTVATGLRILMGGDRPYGG